MRRWSLPELLRVAGPLALAALAFVGLSAIKLVPELRWIESSGRAGGEMGAQWGRDTLFEAVHAELGSENRSATLVHALARIYEGGGGITLLAGLAVGVFVALRRRAGIGLLLGTMLCLVIASGVAHDLAFDVLPGYDKMRKPTRFLYMAAWGGTLIAGYGADAAFRALRRSGPWLPASVAALLIAFLALETNSVPGLRYKDPLLMSVTERHERARAIYAAPMEEDGFLRIHQRSDKEQAVWVALGLEAMGGALGGSGSANATYSAWARPDESVAWQETSNRFVLDALNVRYSCFLRLFDAEHLELVFRPRDVFDEVQRMNELFLRRPFVYRREGALARASIVDAPVLLVGSPEERERALRAAIELPGVRALTHVFVESDELDLEQLTPDDVQGYGAVVFAGRSRGAPEVVAWAERAGRGRVFARPPLGAVWAEGPPLETLRVEPLDDGRIGKGLARVDVDLTGVSGGFLLLSELMTLQPGWTATIDRVPATLLRADGLITAVRLPPGARRASFRFVPPGFVAGAWITVLTAIAWTRSSSASRRSASTKPSR